tara:strand:- start:3160 stop:3711 length:552 start_codon:yes stop_codon:yes gene_type:complete
MASNTNERAVYILSLMKCIYGDPEKNFLIKLLWEDFSSNPGALELLKKNKERIDGFHMAAFNDNPECMPLLLEILEKIEDDEEKKNIYRVMSGNPIAVDWIKKNKDKISWRHLCKNPASMHIFKDYIDENPGMEEYPWESEEKGYRYLSLNGSIFMPDYNAMKRKNKKFRDEIKRMFDKKLHN